MDKGSRVERSEIMRVELPLVIKTYDIDFAGHVSNIVYIRWLEDLRLQWLETYFPLAPQLAQGIAPVLIRTEIEYRRALRLGDRPLGRMWVTGVTRARWTLEAEFVVDGTVAAWARQAGCFVRLETGRPVPVPAPLRDRFSM